MQDRFSADPTVVFMTAVLEEVAQGRLLSPRFQRPLVWTWTQRRDLLSSIHEGLPIGALMIWVSSEGHVERYKSLGPYQLPPPSGSGNRFLMDGVQRVSTLFGALRAHDSWAEIDAETDQTVSDFGISVDLDAEDDESRFVREVDISPIALAADPSRFLPLRFVLDSRRLLRFQRSVPSAFERRVDVSDEIAAAFREYKIPLITLNNASLATVTKSFQRVNSRGASINEIHMINALTYSPNFDLLAELRDRRRQDLASLGWADLDEDVILRALKIRLGVEAYTPKPEETSKRLKQHPRVLGEIFDGVVAAAKLLRSFGIYSPDIVPYKMQLVGLCALLSTKANTENISLESWLWVTTYTEAFGLSARQSEVALSDLYLYSQTGRFAWNLRQTPVVKTIVGRRADFRSARGRALSLSLARRIDLVTDKLGTTTLNSYKGEAFLSVANGGITSGRLGWRFLVSPDNAANFKKRLHAGALSASERVMHIISDQSWAAILQGDITGFLESREQEIFAFELAELLEPSMERLQVPVMFAGPSIAFGDPILSD